MMHSLYYYHDPMCSWCWGYRPTKDRLIASLPETISLVNVLGGLAPDSDEPMPESMQDSISGYWHKIHDTLGTEFNFDFWERCSPRRSTYPACRAVIAAGWQDQEAAMIDAIQRAYYLRAMNPSDRSILETLAQEIGLDVLRFQADFTSPKLEQKLQGQIQFTERSPTSGLPSLALDLGVELLPVALDYQSESVTLKHIDELCGSSAELLTP